MEAVRWERYPRVAGAERPRAWLQLQADLQLAPKTIDAYGRCLDGFLAYCAAHAVAPEALTREQVGGYVRDLATRPRPRAANVVRLDSGTGLANATLQQRLTVVRLFCDYLVECGVRADNPVGRGRYVPGRGFGGARERGLIPRLHKLPWIPGDAQWLAVLGALKDEPLRNRAMLLLAYDGALRRQELVTLALDDLDFAYRQVRIRAEHAKNGRERVVGWGETTGRFLAAYLAERRALRAAGGRLFLSTSRRNPGQPLSLVMWSKIVQGLAGRCQLPQFSTHTTRHLRLTHLARAGMDLHQIALYAGHRSLQTTMQYIHLSGVELTAAVARSLAGFERWLVAAVGEVPG